MSSERSLICSSGIADAGLRDKRAWYRSIDWPPEEPGKRVCVRHQALRLDRSMFEGWPCDEDLPADAPFGTLASIRERGVFCDLCCLIHHASQGILHDEDVDVVGCWIRDGELTGKGVVQHDKGGRVTSLRLRVTSPHLERRYNKYQICDVVPLGLNRPVAFFSGRGVSEKELDFSLIRSWLRDCEQWHEDCLQTESWTKLPSGAQLIRLLDLEMDCLVETPSPGSYICLSYVWGKAPVFKTLKGNIHEMLKPGSLSRVGKQIPLSIRDAIQAARFLEERYLWVDSLCIIQDDNEDKMQQISIMGEIYRRASLTLVVAGGDNANCGIGGIQKGSRDIRQNIARYSDDLELVQLFPDGNQAVEDSVWNTRGWTYQERLLSRRCIFFVNDMAYFHCQQADWSEDWKGEHPQLVRSASMTEIRLSMSWEAPTMHPRDVYHLAKRKTYFYEYCRLVKEYTSRGMTVTSDRIAGFEAVLGTFKFMYGISFAQALPEEMFHESLLWHSCSPNPQRINTFPSWAWAGWTGGVEYHDAFEDFNGLPVLRERWRRTRPICDVFFDDLTSHKRRTVRTCDYEMSELPQGWHASVEDSGMVYFQTERPDLLYDAPFTSKAVIREVSAGGLWMHTKVAKFRVTANDRSGSVPRNRHALRFSIVADNPLSGHGEAWVGSVCLSRPWRRQQKGNYSTPFDFIVLSEAYGFGADELDPVAAKELKPYSVMNVMLIKKIERVGVQGALVVERQGVGRMLKSAWETCSETSDVLIV